MAPTSPRQERTGSRWHQWAPSEVASAVAGAPSALTGEEEEGIVTGMTEFFNLECVPIQLSELYENIHLPGMITMLFFGYILLQSINTL